MTERQSNKFSQLADDIQRYKFTEYLLTLVVKQLFFEIFQPKAGEEQKD